MSKELERRLADAEDMLRRYESEKDAALEVRAAAMEEAARLCEHFAGQRGEFQGGRGEKRAAALALAGLLRDRKGVEADAPFADTIGAGRPVAKGK